MYSAFGCPRHVWVSFIFCANFINYINVGIFYLEYPEVLGSGQNVFKQNTEHSEVSRVLRLDDRYIGYSPLYARCCSTERTAFEKVVHLCVCLCALFTIYGM